MRDRIDKANENREKYNEGLKKAYDRSHNVSEVLFKNGDWIKFVKPHESRNTHMDVKAFGPYQMEGKDERGNLLLRLIGPDGAAAGEVIAAHPDDCKYWPGRAGGGGKNRTDVPVQEEKEIRITLPSPNHKQRTYLELLGSTDAESISLSNILGKKIRTYWSDFKNWEQGTVKSYDVKRKKFWVDYPGLHGEDPSSDDHTFPEDLLGKRSPAWFIEGEKPPEFITELPTYRRYFSVPNRDDTALQGGRVVNKVSSPVKPVSHVPMSQHGSKKRQGR
jgi:hypothetical protein